MQPKISIVMVDGSFRENFFAINSFADQSLSRDEFEILWVEYYNKCRPELSRIIDSISNSKIIKLNRKGEYHSSFCFNRGIMEAKGELIVIPDADVYIEREFLECLWKLHNEDEKLVTYNYRYNELERDHIESVELEHLKKVCVLTHPSNWGGCVTTRKKWFMQVNGYEQHPIFGSGDHGNDFDMYTRFKALGLHICWSPNPKLRLYHPWHPGTLIYTYSHKLQAIISRYRAKNLMFLPYNGIDSEFDSSIPDDLIAEIRIAREKFNNEYLKLEIPPENII